MRTPQEPDRLRTGTLALAGGVAVVITLALVGISWLLVAPRPPSTRTPAPSLLERSLFDDAAGGLGDRRDGARELGRIEWIDRSQQVVRIPIERAIDAVVADPALIRGTGSGR